MGNDHLIGLVRQQAGAYQHQSASKATHAVGGMEGTNRLKTVVNLTGSEQQGGVPMLFPICFQALTEPKSAVFRKDERRAHGVG